VKIDVFFNDRLGAIEIVAIHAIERLIDERWGFSGRKRSSERNP
jgi:hypothetical protein